MIIKFCMKKKMRRFNQLSRTQYICLIIIIVFCFVSKGRKYIKNTQIAP